MLRRGDHFRPSVSCARTLDQFGSLVLWLHQSPSMHELMRVETKVNHHRRQCHPHIPASAQLGFGTSSPLRALALSTGAVGLSLPKSGTNGSLPTRRTTAACTPTEVHHGAVEVVVPCCNSKVQKAYPARLPVLHRCAVICQTNACFSEDGFQCPRHERGAG